MGLPQIFSRIEDFCSWCRLIKDRSVWQTGSHPSSEFSIARSTCPRSSVYHNLKRRLGTPNQYHEIRQSSMSGSRDVLWERGLILVSIAFCAVARHHWLFSSSSTTSDMDEVRAARLRALPAIHQGVSATDRIRLMRLHDFES